MSADTEKSQGSEATANPKSTYRPEIDALRAIAVIAVMINDFNKEGSVAEWPPRRYLASRARTLYMFQAVSRQFPGKADQAIAASAAGVYAGYQRFHLPGGS